MAIDKDQVKKIVPILEKLKNLFMEAAAPIVEEQLSEAETADGKKLSISGGIVEGSKVEIVNVDGNAPAPDGEYSLKDGNTITIKDGVILSIKEPAAEAAADPTAMNEFKAEESFNALKAEFEAQKNIITDLLEKFAALTGANVALSNEVKLSKTIQAETFKVVEALAGLPIESPIESKAKGMFSKEDKLAQIKSTINELKK